MSQLVSCPECKKGLQVPDDLLGKKVQCPECAHYFTATLGDDELSTGTTSSPPVRTKKGLDKKTDSGSSKKKRYDDDDSEDEEDRPRRSRRDDDVDYAPHRSGMILAFGIIALVGLIVFPLITYVFGPMAWFMGNGDLREISEGRMDPEGESMTQTGRILGMIGTIIALVGLLVGCVFLIGWLFCVGLIVGGAAANKNNNFGPGRKGF